MGVMDLFEQAQHLTWQERKELVKLLVDSLDRPDTSIPKRHLSELRGLGKEIWQGIDAQDYIDQLRDEWDARP